MAHKLSFIPVVSTFLATALTLFSANSAIAQEKGSFIGPAFGFIGGGTLFGVTSKFKLVDSISIRPFVEFASVSGGGQSASVTLFGLGATYNFHISDSGFTPYAGIGYGGVAASASGVGSIVLPVGVYFEVGTDFNIADSIVLNGNYKFLQGGGFFNIGAGLRF
jgi:opacity protein-like surface antigen